MRASTTHGGRAFQDIFFALFVGIVGIAHFGETIAWID